MVKKLKEKYFYFYKRKDKRYRYEDELGLKKIRQSFPGNGAKNACWYFLMHTKIVRKRTELPL